MHLTAHAPSSPRRFGAGPLAWLLVVALLVAPLLGQLHMLVHGSGLGGLAVSLDHRAHLAPNAVQASAQPAGLAAVADTLNDLFAGHDKAGDCRLYDQASHGDLHSHAFASLPAVALPALLAVFAAEHVAARRIAPSCARGPPASR